MKLNHLQPTRLHECGEPDQCRYSHWIIEIRVAQVKCEKDLRCHDVLTDGGMNHPTNDFLLEYYRIQYKLYINLLVLLYISCDREYDHPGGEWILNHWRASCIDSSFELHRKQTQRCIKQCQTPNLLMFLRAVVLPLLNGCSFKGLAASGVLLKPVEEYSEPTWILMNHLIFEGDGLKYFLIFTFIWGILFWPTHHLV